jgi:hypothetical protein
MHYSGMFGRYTILTILITHGKLLDLLLLLGLQYFRSLLLCKPLVRLTESFISSQFCYHICQSNTSTIASLSYYKLCKLTEITTVGLSVHRAPYDLYLQVTSRYPCLSHLQRGFGSMLRKRKMD